MLEGAVGAEGIYELPETYWSGSWIISLSNRKLMNIFQLLHGHAQNQMKGTVLKIAFWYISLDCSQMQLLVLQTKNNNLFYLIEASFGFLANSQVIWCNQSFPKDAKEFKAFHFLLGFLLPKNKAPWISLFAVQSEILITKTAGGRSNEHLYMGQQDKKKKDDRSGSIGKSSFPSFALTSLYFMPWSGSSRGEVTMKLKS